MTKTERTIWAIRFLPRWVGGKRTKTLRGIIRKGRPSMRTRYNAPSGRKSSGSRLPKKMPSVLHLASNRHLEIRRHVALNPPQMPSRWAPHEVCLHRKPQPLLRRKKTDEKERRKRRLGRPNGRPSENENSKRRWLRRTSTPPSHLKTQTRTC